MEIRLCCHLELAFVQNWKYVFYKYEGEFPIIKCIFQIYQLKIGNKALLPPCVGTAGHNTSPGCILHNVQPSICHHHHLHHHHHHHRHRHHHLHHPHHHHGNFTIPRQAASCTLFNPQFVIINIFIINIVIAVIIIIIVIFSILLISIDIYLITIISVIIIMATLYQNVTKSL